MKPPRSPCRASAIFLVSLVTPLALAAQTNVFPSSGNVGIGTTNPTAKLHVLSGTVKVEGNTGNVWNDASIYSVDDAAGGRAFAFGSRAGGFSISDETSFAVRFLIDGSGNVGLGTTSPRAKLDVAGAGNMSLGFDYAGTNSIIKTFTTGHAVGNAPSELDIGIIDGGGTVGMIVKDVRDGTFNSQSIEFATHHGGVSASTRMTIDKDGNVGIGTTSPANKLEVRADGTGYYWAGRIACANFPSDRQVFLGTYSGSSVVGSHNFALNAWAPLYVNTTNGVSDGGTVLIAGTGNVGIGTTNPTHKLAVNGTIRAKEVIVDTGWADYVFAKDYRLAPLSEVEQHIEREGRLPGLPSAQEVAAHGVSMGEMQAKLLAKIEELTLHQIEQEKRQRAQERQIAAQQSEINTLRARLSKP